MKKLTYSLIIAAAIALTTADGKLMVTGLSNQEFSSAFRSIPSPIAKQQHQFRAFTTATPGGKKNVVASYTCTPLVLFPVDDLKPGTHVKGRIVAEVASGNSPIDMITMAKGGETSIPCEQCITARQVRRHTVRPASTSC